MSSKHVSIETDSLVTFAEAALMLGVSRPTIYNKVTANHLHPVRIGNNQYLLRTEVEALQAGKEFTS